jgi:hypothetical protein
MKAIVFDIETGGQPPEVARQFLREFDPADVKLGNLKDPEKVQAKIEEARARHEADFLETTALRGFTAEVLAIGYQRLDLDDPPGGGPEPDGDLAPSEEMPGEAAGSQLLTIIHSNVTNRPGTSYMQRDGDRVVAHCMNQFGEAEVLLAFWRVVAANVGIGCPLVGFNSNYFDLPMLYQRSMFYGLPVPALRRGRYWRDWCVDLKDLWACGAYGGELARGTLDEIARFFGIAGKTGKGAEFAEKFRGTPESQAEALKYLANDVEMTVGVARAMYLSVGFGNAV